MSTPRLVPWKGWKEWSCVYENIFLGTWDADPGKWRKKVADSLGTINMWRTRCKLPLYIDSTANVLKCIFDHAVNAASVSPNVLRLSYAMSLTRLVNGVVENEQRGQYAQAVSTIAERVGLPRELVDLRHEATHGDLPSLTRLKSAASVALNWLHNQYWRVQADHLQNIVTTIRNFLDEYLAALQDEKGAEKMLHLMEQVGQRIPTKQVRSHLIPLLVGVDAHEEGTGENMINGILAQPLSVLQKDSAKGRKRSMAELYSYGPKTKEQEEKEKHDFAVTSRMWLPLIRKFQLTWPHFSTCFFFQLLSRLCILNGAKQDSRGSEKPLRVTKSSSALEAEIYLSGWIRILLSDEWHNACDEDFGSTNRTPRHSPAPDSKEEISEKRKGTQGRKAWALPAAKMCILYPGPMTTTLLQDLMRFDKDRVGKLLAVHRILNKNYKGHTTEDELTLDNPSTPPKKSLNNRPKPTQTENLPSLGDMEAFLKMRKGRDKRRKLNNSGAEVTTKGESENEKIAWSKCRSWIPCAIGSTIDTFSVPAHRPVPSTVKILNVSVSDLADRAASSKKSDLLINHPSIVTRDDNNQEHCLDHVDGATENRVEPEASNVKNLASKIILLT